MALPKLSELSPAVQLLLVLVVGAALWGTTEYLLLKPVQEENATKTANVDRLTREVEPLRPYRERLPILEAENRQLEVQLQNLQQIVPDEKEVDNLIRQVQAEASVAGVFVRRVTAKPTVQQELYIAVPFEVEMDGAFYDVMQFYDRVGKLERIINVSDLKMAGLQAKKSIGQKNYPYAPNETVAAVCIVTTFYSREDVPPPAAAEPPARGRRARAPSPPAAQ
ncbi:MAG: hypothetical protein A3F68_13360 [Acidobacteria bacterium RIFCSPLOWO2_12_FULL_54_10]|nr:MAG: hypothetical protein A3F68_13360 [Acidobacteria bacterium RIFCSPLOWO2_12_FULL_54_10]